MSRRGATQRFFSGRFQILVRPPTRHALLHSPCSSVALAASIIALPAPALALGLTSTCSCTTSVAGGGLAVLMRVDHNIAAV